MTSLEPVAVLIVEDEALIRMMIAEELDDAGIAVFEASDASEALALFDQHPQIDVLFTDINIPGAMNGFALARSVRAKRPDMKIYLASGRERPDDKELPVGATFIGKPYNVRQIAELIRQPA